MNTVEIRSTRGVNTPYMGTSLTGKPTLDVAAQGLRILRCTAQSMANSPEGLRFKQDSQPWLEGLVCVSAKRRLRSQS